ncbi:MAG: cytochrome c1 [Legionellales bacterium]|nr:cytochrome c1 [Legionellales bacterium]
MMSWAASESTIALFPYKANYQDKLSLQRGAKLFMNYCSGCHSLGYMRYSQLAQGVGITDDYGDLHEDLVKDHLIFTEAKIHDHILTSMSNQDANIWFGTAVPDLTLVARVRGAAWLYTYLRTFYRDPNRPWGANNLIFPDVGMPNVLLPLQGDQIAIYREEVHQVNGETKTVKVFDQLQPQNNGSMNAEQFDQAVKDLVNFLSFTAEPMREQQHRIGIWVLIFLAVFAVVAYLLKREYWKDIH